MSTNHNWPLHYCHLPRNQALLSYSTSRELLMTQYVTAGKNDQLLS